MKIIDYKPTLLLFAIGNKSTYLNMKKECLHTAVLISILIFDKKKVEIDRPL